MIRVRLFAQMAARAGMAELTIHVPDDSQLAAVKPILQDKLGALVWPPGTLMAVNQEYAGAEHPLRDHDEVAIIPPVSGGNEYKP